MTCRIDRKGIPMCRWLATAVIGTVLALAAPVSGAKATDAEGRTPSTRERKRNRRAEALRTRQRADARGRRGRSRKGRKDAPAPVAAVKVNTPQSLQRAIQDLIETFGAKYPRGQAYLTRLGADEKAERLIGRSTKPGTYEYLMRSIRGEKVSQEQARVVYRSW